MIAVHPRLQVIDEAHLGLLMSAQGEECRLYNGDACRRWAPSEPRIDGSGHDGYSVHCTDEYTEGYGDDHGSWGSGDGSGSGRGAYGDASLAAGYGRGGDGEVLE
jgi:hypothetical protein